MFSLTRAAAFSAEAMAASRLSRQRPAATRQSSTRGLSGKNSRAVGPPGSSKDQGGYQTPKLVADF
jgi:hypothetical protein